MTLITRYYDPFGNEINAAASNYLTDLNSQLAIATQAANFANQSLLPAANERIASLDNTIQELQNQLGAWPAKLAIEMNKMGMSKAEEQSVMRNYTTEIPSLTSKLNALNSQLVGSSSVEAGYQGQISALNKKITALENPSVDDLSAYITSHGLAGTLFEGLFGIGSTESTGQAVGQIGRGAGEIIEKGADIATEVTKMLPLILIVVAISAIRK